MREDHFYINPNWFKGYVIKYSGKNVIEQACTLKHVQRLSGILRKSTNKGVNDE